MLSFFSFFFYLSPEIIPNSMIQNCYLLNLKYLLVHTFICFSVCFYAPHFANMLLVKFRFKNGFLLKLVQKRDALNLVFISAILVMCHVCLFFLKTDLMAIHLKPRISAQLFCVNIFDCLWKCRRTTH